MNLYRVIFIMICLLAGKYQMAFSEPNYYFKQLSLNEGLSQSTVKCIWDDHKGLIWIGTHFGLNCFDREQIKSYYKEDGNSSSIPNNEIDFIVEDSKKNLWIGTAHGLALYDRLKDNFITQFCDDRLVDVHAFLMVEEGILFFGRSQFYMYTYNSGKLRSLPLHPKGHNDILVNNAQLFDAKKKIILLTCRWNGAWWYHLDSGKAERVAFISDLEIPTAHVDTSRQLWVSIYGKGVFCYSKDGKLVRHLSKSNSLTDNVVLDIDEKDGDIWLATDGGGLNIYNVQENTSRTIEHDSSNPYSCPVNSFYSLYKDNENNIWAGSIRGGLIGIKEVYIKTYKDAVLNSLHGLSNKTVIGMFQDQDGIIWLGTDGGGINRFNPADQHFRHYPSTYPSKVVAIISHGKEELILSLFGQGLYFFNKETGKMREIELKDKAKQDYMFRIGKSVHLSRLDKNRIYLMADSVYLYNLSDNSMETVSVREPDTAIASLQPISSTEYVNYLRSEWAIYELDHTQKTLRAIYRLKEDTSELITSVTRDKAGDFWISTTSRLYRFNPLNQKEDKVSSIHFVGISSMHFDSLNRLWIGTYNSLYVYVPETGKFILFGESDGVSANEYISKPPLISTSGDIYLAGVMGLVRINNQISFLENPDPVISLVSLILDGAPLSQEITDTDHPLTIPWDHTSVTFKVIAKENDLMRKKMFRFHIQGDRKETVESYDHFITYHSLPVGQYQLFVSCNKKNGDWSKPVLLATLTVLPPWWQTPIFRGIALFAVLVSIIAVILLLLKRSEDKMRWAIKEHEQKIYEEKISFLINISHELRTPLTLIYAPLKRILNQGNIKNDMLFAQLSDIFKQTRRIKNIINMVLDVRKMETGGDTLNIHSQQINSWIRSVADDFINECNVHQIQLRYDLDETVDEVPFDPFKCEVVLSNLLMNALKFSKPNTTITLSSKRQENSVRISVSDQGIGLKHIDKSQLFRRFYQGEHNLQGSGIGLSYSQLLIEMHGGQIAAVDNEQAGATFYYELPLENKAGAIVARPYLNELLNSPHMDDLHDMSSDDMRKYVILVVEDEPELRNYLKEALSPGFRRVYLANDGQEALEMTIRYLPDIVISDVMMPRMDGFELCKQIKNNIEISHIPVVLLTARTDTESSKLGYKLGADVYLPKPFDLDFLQTVIQNQLKNRSMVKRRYKEQLAVIPTEEDTISHADEKFIHTLNGLISDKIADPNLDVAFVAGQMAMSRATLYNKVKALTGASVGDYINKFRMIRAVELLTNKDDTILEISEKVGFSSQRYFSTAFKQVYGTTPTQYRQDNRKQKP